MILSVAIVLSSVSRSILLNNQVPSWRYSGDTFAHFSRHWSCTVSVLSRQLLIAHNSAHWFIGLFHRDARALRERQPSLSLSFIEFTVQLYLFIQVTAEWAILFTLSPFSLFRAHKKVNRCTRTATLVKYSNFSSERTRTGNLLKSFSIHESRRQRNDNNNNKVIVIEHFIFLFLTHTSHSISYDSLSAYCCSHGRKPAGWVSGGERDWKRERDRGQWWCPSEGHLVAA